MRLIIAIVVTVICYTVILKMFTPDYLIKERVVETKVYTEVDSSSVYKEYSQRIPDAEVDTVFVTIEIPEPTVDNDLSTYETMYSDSLITAKWSSIIEGRLHSQEFEYFIRNRIVREYTHTINQRVYTYTTETITKVENPRPYFITGVQLTHLEYVTFTAGYVHSNRYQINYSYTPALDAHTIGFSVPLRFSLRSFRILF